LWIDPAAIVPDKNPQLVGTILKVQIDVVRPGMSERIHHGFPADQVDVIADSCSQWHCISFYYDAKIGRGRPEFQRDSGK